MAPETPAARSAAVASEALGARRLFPQIPHRSDLRPM
jgi:hypothetical protein